MGEVQFSYRPPVFTSLIKLVLVGLVTVLASCGGGGDGAAPLRTPTLLTQPADQSAKEGSSATFSVTADGSSPLSYQWSRSIDGIVFTAIDGATAAAYVTPSTAIADSGTRYRVAVSNAAGSIVSSAATLLVTQVMVAPSVTVQPADQVVIAPAIATFHVTATGTALSYQWQFSSGAGVTFAPIPGAANSPTLTLSSTVAAQDGFRYRVLVSNALSSVLSNSALLTVHPTPAAPTITTQPAAQTIVAGQAASFSIVAAGTPAPTIQWQLNGSNLGEGSQTSRPCSGATANGSTGATLTLTAVPLSCSGATFSAIASNGVAPDATSLGAVLTVNPAPAAPSVTLQPATATVTPPAVATFTAAANGVPTPTVQWQQSLDGGATWANITGAVSASYTTPATQLGDDGKQFRAVFSNASGSATTSAATLRVLPPPPGVSLLVGDIGGSGNFDGAGNAARFNSPAGITVDVAGNTYVADAGSNLIRKITVAGVVSTVAGSGNFDYADGNGRNAAFFAPQGIAIDSAGILYVADTQNSVIRKIAPDGSVSTLAGLAGTVGSGDGLGAAARFNMPQGIAVDPTGTIYVADTGNRTVRMITAGGMVSTLVTGASRLALAAPTGLTVDGAGVVYVADSGLTSIQVVSPSGSVSPLSATMVGSGGAITPATFNHPFGIAMDAAGALYVADTRNDAIRKIAPGGLTTVLAGTMTVRGNADGIGAAALFYAPRGVAIDSGGVVHVADTSNHTVRTIDATGRVTTTAGLTENAGAVDGSAMSARFAPIRGFAIDPGGNIFVSDSKNFTVRKVTPAGVVSTFAGSPGVSGVGDSSDDGIGSGARFAYGTPSSIAADSLGNLYVDSVSTIRKITPTAAVSGFVGSNAGFGTTDGTGSQALFTSINGLATDAAGNVYVADYGAIRKVSPAGVVTTLAGVGDQSGNVDGTGAAARFFSLSSLVVDPSGIVYAVDALNYTIRKVTPAGVVTTLAGSGSGGVSADGIGSAAQFASPLAITSDGAGNLYVADGCAIRKVTTTGVVSTVLGVAGECGIRLGSDARIYASFALAVLGPKRLLIASHDALLVANLP